MENMSPMAEDIIAKADSYTEISPSDEYVRKLAKADSFIYEADMSTTFIIMFLGLKCMRQGIKAM